MGQRLTTSGALSQYRALVRFFGVLFVSLLLLASCSAQTEIGTLDAASSRDVVEVDDGPATLPSEQVYEAIRDSIVYVEAPNGASSGSGIVIDGGWILTNAHVVGRFDDMRIGRSDGVDLGLHQVFAVDWIFDLALVGPIDDLSLTPAMRGVSADLDLGSRVLLVGFPDEDSFAPTPTLTEGIVSRRRVVALGDYGFLQVDATIAPGQSGGALINGAGELVGISGLEFGLGEFGLAFESDPMWARIDMLAESAGNALPSGPATFTLQDEVGPRRQLGFTVEVGPSGELDLLAASNADLFIDLQTLGGTTVSRLTPAADPFRANTTEDLLYVDDQIQGGEQLIARVDPGTYQVVIGSFSDTLESVEVTSVSEMRSFDDVEEGSQLPLGQIVEGQFDWSRDSDRWSVELSAGETITITADGIADVIMALRLDDQVVASSDDEGLGLFGTGSFIEFEAVDDGDYTLEIGTFDETRWGYLIQADVAPS